MSLFVSPSRMKRTKKKPFVRSSMKAVNLVKVVKRITIVMKGELANILHQTLHRVRTVIAVVDQDHVPDTEIIEEEDQEVTVRAKAAERMVN